MLCCFGRPVDRHVAEKAASAEDALVPVDSKASPRSSKSSEAPRAVDSGPVVRVLDVVPSDETTKAAPASTAPAPEPEPEEPWRMMLCHHLSGLLATLRLKAVGCWIRTEDKQRCFLLAAAPTSQSYLRTALHGSLLGASVDVQDEHGSGVAAAIALKAPLSFVIPASGQMPSGMPADLQQVYERVGKSMATCRAAQAGLAATPGWLVAALPLLVGGECFGAIVTAGPLEETAAAGVDAGDVASLAQRTTDELMSAATRLAAAFFDTPKAIANAHNVCALVASVSSAADHTTAVRSTAPKIDAVLAAAEPQLPPLCVTPALVVAKVPQGCASKGGAASSNGGCSASTYPQVQLYCTPAGRPPVFVPAYESVHARSPMRADALAALLTETLAAPVSSAALAASRTPSTASNSARQALHASQKQKQLVLRRPEEELPATQQADLAALVVANARANRGSVVMVSCPMPSMACAFAVYVCAAARAVQPAETAAGPEAAAGGSAVDTCERGGPVLSTGASQQGYSSGANEPVMLSEALLNRISKHVSSVVELLASALEQRVISNCLPGLVSPGRHGSRGYAVLDVNADTSGLLTVSLACTEGDDSNGFWGSASGPILSGESIPISQIGTSMTQPLSTPGAGAARTGDSALASPSSLLSHKVHTVPAQPTSPLAVCSVPSPEPCAAAQGQHTAMDLAVNPAAQPRAGPSSMAAPAPSLVPVPSALETAQATAKAAAGLLVPGAPVAEVAAVGQPGTSAQPIPPPPTAAPGSANGAPGFKASGSFGVISNKSNDTISQDTALEAAAAADASGRASPSRSPAACTSATSISIDGTVTSLMARASGCSSQTILMKQSPDMGCMAEMSAAVVLTPPPNPSRSRLGHVALGLPSAAGPNAGEGPTTQAVTPQPTASVTSTAAVVLLPRAPPASLLPGPQAPGVQPLQIHNLSRTPSTGAYHDVSVSPGSKRGFERQVPAPGLVDSGHSARGIFPGSGSSGGNNGIIASSNSGGGHGGGVMPRHRSKDWSDQAAAERDRADARPSATPGDSGQALHISRPVKVLSLDKAALQLQRSNGSHGPSAHPHLLQHYMHPHGGQQDGKLQDAATGGPGVAAAGQKPTYVPFMPRRLNRMYLPPGAAVPPSACVPLSPANVVPSPSVMTGPYGGVVAAAASISSSCSTQGSVAPHPGGRHVSAIVGGDGSQGAVCGGLLNVLPGGPSASAGAWPAAALHPGQPPRSMNVVHVGLNGADVAPSVALAPPGAASPTLSTPAPASAVNQAAMPVAFATATTPAAPEAGPAAARAVPLAGTAAPLGVARAVATVPPRAASLAPERPPSSPSCATPRNRQLSDYAIPEDGPLEYTVSETVQMMRMLSQARGAHLSARMRRVRVTAKIQSSHPESLPADLPSQFAKVALRAEAVGLFAGGAPGSWILTGVAARRGCVELVFDLVQVRSSGSGAGWDHEAIHGSAAAAQQVWMRPQRSAAVSGSSGRRYRRWQGTGVDMFGEPLVNDSEDWGAAHSGREAQNGQWYGLGALGASEVSEQVWLMQACGLRPEAVGAVLQRCSLVDATADPWVEVQMGYAPLGVSNIVWDADTAQWSTACINGVRFPGAAAGSALATGQGSAASAGLEAPRSTFLDVPTLWLPCAVAVLPGGAHTLEHVRVVSRGLPGPGEADELTVRVAGGFLPSRISSGLRVYGGDRGAVPLPMSLDEDPLAAQLGGAATGDCCWRLMDIGGALPRDGGLLLIECRRSRDGHRASAEAGVAQSGGEVNAVTSAPVPLIVLPERHSAAAQELQQLRRHLGRLLLGSEEALHAGPQTNQAMTPEAVAAAASVRGEAAAQVEMACQQFLMDLGALLDAATAAAVTAAAATPDHGLPSKVYDGRVDATAGSIAASTSRGDGTAVAQTTSLLLLSPSPSQDPSMGSAAGSTAAACRVTAASLMQASGSATGTTSSQPRGPKLVELQVSPVCTTDALSSMPSCSSPLNKMPPFAGRPSDGSDNLVTDAVDDVWPGSCAATRGLCDFAEDMRQLLHPQSPPLTQQPGQQMTQRVAGRESSSGASSAYREHLLDLACTLLAGCCAAGMRQVALLVLRLSVSDLSLSSPELLVAEAGIEAHCSLELLSALAACGDKSDTNPSGGFASGSSANASAPTVASLTTMVVAPVRLSEPGRRPTAQQDDSGWSAVSDGQGTGTTGSHSHSLAVLLVCPRSETDNVGGGASDTRLHEPPHDAPSPTTRWLQDRSASEDPNQGTEAGVATGQEAAASADSVPVAVAAAAAWWQACSDRPLNASAEAADAAANPPGVLSASTRSCNDTTTMTTVDLPTWDSLSLSSTAVTPVAAAASPVAAASPRCDGPCRSSSLHVASLGREQLASTAPVVAAAALSAPSAALSAPSAAVMSVLASSAPPVPLPAVSEQAAAAAATAAAPQLNLQRFLLSDERTAGDGEVCLRRDGGCASAASSSLCALGRAAPGVGDEVQMQARQLHTPVGATPSQGPVTRATVSSSGRNNGEGGSRRSSGAWSSTDPAPPPDDMDDDVESEVLRHGGELTQQRPGFGAFPWMLNVRENFRETEREAEYLQFVANRSRGIIWTYFVFVAIISAVSCTRAMMEDGPHGCLTLLLFSGAQAVIMGWYCIAHGAHDPQAMVTASMGCKTVRLLADVFMGLRVLKVPSLLEPMAVRGVEVFAEAVMRPVAERVPSSLFYMMLLMELPCVWLLYRHFHEIFPDYWMRAYPFWRTVFFIVLSVMANALAELYWRREFRRWCRGLAAGTCGLGLTAADADLGQMKPGM